MLCDGDSSRLEQRLVHTDELVTDISVGCGLFGAPLDARDPDTFTVTAIHPSTVDVDRGGPASIVILALSCRRE